MTNNIFNIPCNYNFLSSLHHWLLQNFSDLEKIKIILPSRRASNELRNIFSKNNYCKILPQIKALGDIAIEDFSEFIDQEDEQFFADLLTARKMDSLEAIFFISHQISKLDIFGKLNFEESSKIAIKLQEIFDEIEFEQINLSKIEEIDDINLALHRQITLEFIKDFYTQTKTALIKNNLYFSSAYQNYIIDKYNEILSRKKPDKTIIIAGSTGSLNCAKKLIKTIASKKNGFVVFNNFLEVVAENTDSRDIPTNHPQFFNNQLFNFLELSKNSVKDLMFSSEILAPNFRNDFIIELTKSSIETISWQNFSNHINIDKICKDISDNFIVIEAENNLKEAEIIVDLIQKNLSSCKSIAIVNNSIELTKTIELKLKHLEINFFNSNSIILVSNELIVFILKILQLNESDFNSWQLLSLFKNKLFAFFDDNFITKFEIEILRQSREYSGLKGIKELCKKNLEINNFFNNFLNSLPKNNSIEELKISIEKLTKKSWNNLVYNNKASEEITLFFSNLEHLNYQIESANEFEFLCSQISYFEDSNPQSCVKILSNIEARLLNFDLVFICGLNYGDFPQIIEDNWLGKQISRELGIDRQSKKIGQNAFDFCHYLGNKKIVLSRSVKNSNDIRIASPFLQKFKTLIKKIDINNLVTIKKFENNFANINFFKINIPALEVGKEFLPTKLSITSISKLHNDPYSFYCEKILKLYELNCLDYQPNNREFGTFIHKALELYITNNSNQKKFCDIFKLYFNNQEALYTWYARFEKIFKNFLLENIEFLNYRNLLEKSVSFTFNNLEINGKIDRILIDQFNNIKILDYKTGAVPTKKSVVLGDEMQLTLSALVLINSDFCSIEQVKDLNYWHLSIKDEKNITEIIDSKINLSDLINNTQKTLDEIFENFFILNKAFIANQKTKNSIYKNIARFEEWNN